MDDRELNQLLREWEAPAAPPGMRPPRVRRSAWRWLIAGTVPVPVPAAFAAVLLVALSLAGVGPVMPRPSSNPRPSGEATESRRSGEIARYALSGPLDGYDAVLVELNFTPGASAPVHRHPGFILGYVVDGQMRTAINHEADQIVPAGGTFFEPHGALHTAFGSAHPEKPVRAVAFLVVPKGSQSTVPVTEP